MGVAGRPTLLKVLLVNRHLQTHKAFCREFDRVARRLDPSLVATSPSREQFFRWINGRVKTLPSADHCRVLERMFPGHSVAELLAPYDPETTVPRLSGTPSTCEEAATKRRQVFQLGATALTAGLVENVVHGPDLLEQALDRASVGEGRLALLDAEADRLAVAVTKVAPATLLADALSSLTSVRNLLAERQPLQAQRRLARIGAKLAIVVGEIMFNTNHFPLARRWWGAALRAAEEAGDRHLADMALASTAYPPTYSGDPQAVLARLTPRLEQSATATPAIAWMWGFTALAHAVLGDKAAFERAIHRSRTTLDRCAPDTLRPGILSFLPGKHAFYEARGRADLRDVDGTCDATARALAAFEATDTMNPALVRFAQATALARAGEAEEACRIAATALRDPHTFHSVSVVVRAREFDAVLPADAPAVRDWRELLAGVRPPDPMALA